MPFKQIGTPEPKYLAATDILIGDMSDINYEFLLFDRPIILLANDWLKENFPDIGIKTDLTGLNKAIKRSIDDPEEFKEQRKYWLEKTFHKPDGRSSSRVIDIMLQCSNIKDPHLIFIHGGSVVRRSNLEPLVEVAKKKGIKTSFVKQADETGEGNENTIYVAAHFTDLKIKQGYKVHLDHAPKGKGAANVEMSRKDYKRNDYFPWIDLHITAGKAGYERTASQMGSYKDRIIIAGYPKADDLIKLNTEKNKEIIFEEFDFDKSKLLITYAPSGRKSYPKPGGSLSVKVLSELKKISSEYGCNVLVKYKESKKPLPIRAVKKLKRIIIKRLQLIGR